MTAGDNVSIYLNDFSSVPLWNTITTFILGGGFLSALDSLIMMPLYARKSPPPHENVVVIVCP